MFSVKVLSSHWRILFCILEIGFLLVPTLEAAKAWSVTKVKAQDTDKLTISCPTGFHIVITYGEYGNKDSNCSDVFNQYSLARKCNYKQVCVFLQVNDGMKTSCPQGTKQYLNLRYKCMSGQSMLQFTQLTQKDKVHRLSCPLNARIYIVNATYSDNENTCVIDAKEDVKFSCWEHECTYHNTIHGINDTCPNLKMKLLIMYICKVGKYIFKRLSHNHI
ncbi:unnamed protein product [Acanthosepion pharaonis]|uniref:SUEL-type lectin domain-containing protein n=1 Tax=Acanthosepion pharaonis TaxID=158019 RepID=A0A812CHV0_ACAPH|nr:unnamed protein product [Sepia pharaonis]